MGLGRKAAAFGLAALIAAGIVLVGQTLWGVLAVANLAVSPAIPWAAAVQAGVLVLMLLYLSGRGPPKRTAARRRELLRWNPVPWPGFFKALGLGVIALATFGMLWICVSDLVRLPPGLQPKMGGIPPVTALSFLAMGSLAAPLSEEAAFRGYAMGILERAFGGPRWAILGSTLLFAAAHAPQGLDVFKLGLYFIAGLIFALVAWSANSLYPAMAAHAVGDVMGFTVLWPHDKTDHAMGLADPWFTPALIGLAVTAPCAVWALLRLARSGLALRAASAPAFA